MNKHLVNLIKEWMERRSDLEWVEPKYGVICFPSLKNNGDSMKLAEHLLDKYRTLISPGRFFGCEDHFRIGFGAEEALLKGGLENLGRALDDFKN